MTEGHFCERRVGYQARLALFARSCQRNNWCADQHDEVLQTEHVGRLEPPLEPIERPDQRGQADEHDESRHDIPRTHMEP